tara:strand:+ start:334 stop:516 length:183 start_codon:yes stop_codon:yes gene_type:complete
MNHPRPDPGLSADDKLPGSGRFDDLWTPQPARRLPWRGVALVLVLVAFVLALGAWGAGAW